jgi:hypothetical protein
MLSADHFSVPDEQIESALTVTGGDIVYAAAPLAPEPLPLVSPAWSPVPVFGGFRQVIADPACAWPAAPRRQW